MYEGLWSHAEMSVGVMAACLPTFGKLFSPDILNSTAGSSVRRFFNTNWVTWIRSSHSSSEKTGGISLASLPSHSDYDSNHNVFTDKRSLDRFDRPNRLEDFSNNPVAMGPCSDDKENHLARMPFATLPGSQAIYREATFSVTQGERISKQDV